MKEIKNINLHNFGNAAHILFVRTAVGRAFVLSALSFMQVTRKKG